MSYFHPQRMPVLPARRRAAARRQLEELVARSATSARRRRRTRPPAVIATVTAAIVLGTGAAAAVVVLRPVTNHMSVRCFSAPRKSPAYYTTVAEPARVSTPAGIGHARQVCAALFREGILKLGAKVTPPSRPAVRHRAPRLVVCVWQDGTAAVIPGRVPSETCAKLGLQAAARQ